MFCHMNDDMIYSPQMEYFMFLLHTWTAFDFIAYNQAKSQA